MESALRPREIQARIRAGESVDDVAKAAGVPVEKIEPYAGPVLAEREHIAGLAQKGSVRRRGETSGHRQLRVAVGERLSARGVDVEAIDWDALRMEDGRWSVTASYASGEAQRHAIFYFDPRGRFSVAGNDEGRWVLGEQSPVHGPQPGRRPAMRGEDPDSEPTLDLNDELALVRATQELGEEADAPDVVLREADGPDADEQEAEATVVRLGRPEQATEPATDEATDDGTESDGPDEAADVSELDDASELDLLYDMLGGDGYAEDSSRVYSGLNENASESDLGWEPAVVVNYPIDEENAARTPRSPTSVTESLDESPIDEPERTASEPVAEPVTEPVTEPANEDERQTDQVVDTEDEPVPVAEPVAITEPEQPALDDELTDEASHEGTDASTDEVEVDPGPTLLDEQPVETQASDDINQEEGATEPEVRAEPPTPDPAAPQDDASPSRLDPAPGAKTDNDASLEDAVPESSEAPASSPASEQTRSAVEGTPVTSPEAEPAPATEDDVAEAPKKPTPKKRKRAEVPSWDEIMFGGPKRS